MTANTRIKLLRLLSNANAARIGSPLAAKRRPPTSSSGVTRRIDFGQALARFSHTLSAHCFSLRPPQLASRKRPSFDCWGKWAGINWLARVTLTSMRMGRSSLDCAQRNWSRAPEVAVAPKPRLRQFFPSQLLILVAAAMKWQVRQNVWEKADFCSC